MKFLVGLLTGIALGLIIAPASGEEMRERLMNEMSDLADRPRRKAQQAVDTGRERVGEMAKEKAEEAYSKAVDEASGGRLR